VDACGYPSEPKSTRSFFMDSNSTRVAAASFASSCLALGGFVRPFGSDRHQVLQQLESAAGQGGIHCRQQQGLFRLLTDDRPMTGPAAAADLGGGHQHLS
jgi:hypothetical protein